jgi:7,8-dihydropterin-6-yl-methyl-4-(beta-D-ribofuranosyl)aminobenzene 5'-phosphate synthase
MTITALMDNHCDKAGFRGEHGLSLWVEAGDSRVLFDAGSTDAFLANARLLGINPASAEAVVLSHGHYDHGGGLLALFAASRRALTFYAGPGFGKKRYAVDGASRRSIGMDMEGLPAPETVSTVRKISVRLFLLPAAALGDGSRLLERFRAEGREDEEIDDFADELTMVAVEADGLTVITGCAHRGVLNIARAALAVFPGLPLKAIAGGFHLADADDVEIGRVAAGLAELRPGRVLCMHCTGVRGYAGIAAALPGRTAWLSCGSRASI